MRIARFGASENVRNAKTHRKTPANEKNIGKTWDGKFFNFPKHEKEKETQTTNSSVRQLDTVLRWIKYRFQHNLIFAGLISSKLIFSSFNLFSISRAVSPWTDRLIKIPPWRVSQIFFLIGFISNFQPKANFSPSFLVANSSSRVDKAVGKLAKEKLRNVFLPFRESFHFIRGQTVEKPAANQSTLKWLRSQFLWI